MNTHRLCTYSPNGLHYSREILFKKNLFPLALSTARKAQEQGYTWAIWRLADGIMIASSNDGIGNHPQKTKASR